MSTFRLPRRLASLALVAAALGLSSLAAAEPAASAPAVPAAESSSIKKLVEQKFPGANVGAITRAPFGGLYEVQFDDQLVYTDARVSYVFVGALYEAGSKRNLTDERLRKLNRIAWDSLPLDLAMKKVKGNGARKLAIFSDADCPFCARLENELRNVDNVTIYTFLYPIDQLHPDAARKSKMIWCSPDRTAAWDAWFSGQKLPDNAGDCDTPLAATQKLGQKLKVVATPTLVFADGTLVPGAIPAARLESELRQADAEVARAGEAKSAARK